MRFIRNSEIGMRLNGIPSTKKFFAEIELDSANVIAQQNGFIVPYTREQLDDMGIISSSPYNIFVERNNGYRYTIIGG